MHRGFGAPVRSEDMNCCRRIAVDLRFTILMYKNMCLVENDIENNIMQRQNQAWNDTAAAIVVGLQAVRLAGSFRSSERSMYRNWCQRQHNIICDYYHLVCSTFVCAVVFVLVHGLSSRA